MYETPIRYGAFLTAVINFVIVGFALFLAVKGAKALQRRRSETKEAAGPTSAEQELDLLRQIRDRLDQQRPRPA